MMVPLRTVSLAHVAAYITVLWPTLLPSADALLPAARPAHRTRPLSLSAHPDFPDRYKWRIPGSETRSLIFSNWEDEFPIFDDVDELIDIVEVTLEREIKKQGADEPLNEPIRIWNHDTAQLAILKPHHTSNFEGMSHREAIAFVTALRNFGYAVSAFWECHVEFEDTRFAGQAMRGRVVLSFNPP